MFERIKDIIYKIKDYDRLEHDYSVLLCHVTDGRLSKTAYDIDRLLTVVDDILYERDEETYNECKKDLALTWEDIKKKIAYLWKLLHSSCQLVETRTFLSVHFMRRLQEDLTNRKKCERKDGK